MKNLLIILNPHSGKNNGSDALAALKKQAAVKDCRLEVLTTGSAGHAVRLLQQHSLKDIDAVISIGGDGTLNEVVNGLLSRKDHPNIPLGILPSGTGNALMKDLGCRTAQQAIDDIFSGKRTKIDVFKVEMDGTVQYGFNMIGCGLPASINHYAEASRIFKKQRYNVGALKAIARYQPVGYTLSTPSGESFVSDFIIAANTRHIGSGMKIAPDARLDDGWLDVVMLKPFRRLSLLPLFYKLGKGTHMQDVKVIGERMQAFKITAPALSQLNIDGEQHEFRELSLSVLPRHLEVLHAAGVN